MKKTVDIVVTVLSGSVADVSGIPAGVRVLVRDYDAVDDEESLRRDEDGDQYVEEIWTPSD